ncbi:hypothetical protein D6D10_10182 [Aureobasidium pullulans]|uniref:Uncharacterized protein n=1 Tax=Aureobasidium pullulans TaxID=5580 RepID=A0A4S9DUJ8_AURPU|nr:hypothetical protein D6D10_10182 [Aureobasidium pullulans]
MADKQEHDSKRLKTSHPPRPDHDYPMGAFEKRNHLAKLGLLNEYTTLEKSVAAQQDRIKQIELSVYARARMNVEELQLQVAEEYFRSTFIDITLLSSRKAPDWIFDLDALKPHGKFAIWQAYWRYSHLYVPGEAWTKIGKHLLVDNNGARIHEQPWRTSLSRMLRFTDRLFCYPATSPQDLSLSAEYHPHPAKLRDYVRAPRAPENLADDRPNIEFEVLCPFNHNDDEDYSFWQEFESTTIHTFRALMWLFDTLECYRPENRYRLVITPKWKDVKIKDPLTKSPSLEWKGHKENIYAKKDPATKATIPDGLGIKERVMDVINEGLEIWGAFRIEETRLRNVRYQRWKLRQMINARNGLKTVEGEEADQLGATDLPGSNANDPPTRHGIKAARDNVHPRNLVNHLAIRIHNNISESFHPDDELENAYIEFWQRVTLNIPPKLVGPGTWNVNESFTMHVDGLSSNMSGLGSLSEFADDMPGFIREHNVKSQSDIYFPNPVHCEWEMDDDERLAVELYKPEDDDSD